MAKSPWILYGASGKVGNIVLQKSNGKTVIRERVETIKNPRSIEQQKQRMKISTVMSAYSTLKEICDHSFEGISYGAKSMQYFMKKNYSILGGLENPVYNFRQNKSMMPNPLIISEGTITPGIVEYADTSNIQNSCYHFPIAKTAVTNLTVQGLHDALGLQIGDQFTFIVVGSLDGGIIYTYNGDQQQESIAEFARIIFNPEKANEKLLSADYDDGESWNPANFADESFVPDGFDVSVLPLGTSSNMEVIPVATGKIYNHFGYGLILSSKLNNSWKRSTAHFLPTIGWRSQHDPIYTYNPSGEKFLNNATV